MNVHFRCCALQRNLPHHGASHCNSTDRQVAIPFAGMVSGLFVRPRVSPRLVTTQRRATRLYAAHSISTHRDRQVAGIRKGASLRTILSDCAAHRISALHSAALLCATHRNERPSGHQHLRVLVSGRSARLRSASLRAAAQIIAPIRNAARLIASPRSTTQRP